MNARNIPQVLAAITGCILAAVVCRAVERSRTVPTMASTCATLSGQPTPRVVDYFVQPQHVWDSRRTLRIEQIQVKDLVHVEPQELLKQVRRIVLDIEPHARLLGIYAKDSTRGTLDVTGDDRIVYEFTFGYTVASKAIGDDFETGSLEVHAAKSRLFALRGYHQRPDTVYAVDPHCSLHDAWVSAVASGVPGESVSIVQYRQRQPPNPNGDTSWSFLVPGHKEYGREVNGTTCALLSTTAGTQLFRPW